MDKWLKDSPWVSLSSSEGTILSNLPLCRNLLFPCECKLDFFSQILSLYIFSCIQTFSIFSSWPGCTSDFLCQLCSSVEIALPPRDTSCDAFIEKQLHSIFLCGVKLNNRDWLLAEDPPKFSYNCCNLQQFVSKKAFFQPTNSVEYLQVNMQVPVVDVRIILGVESLWDSLWKAGNACW